MTGKKLNWCNIPFRPARFPFFYGWFIIFASIVGIVMSIPGQTMGVSVFTDYLIDALELSRVQLSMAYMFGTIGSALIITRAGKLYDRFGARIIGASAGFLLGLILLFLTGVDTTAQKLHKHIDFVPYHAVAFAVILLAFFVLRFSGQGVLTMASRNMSMKWFNKRRGFANAFRGVFTSFGFAFAPALFNIFIENNGWRGAWLVLSGAVGIGFVAFALLFFRDNPEDCNCKPDGNFRMKKTKRNRPPTLPPFDYTLKEARKTFIFWMFNLATAMNALYVTAMTFHVVSVFETAGMNRDIAVAIFPPISIIALFFQFGASWLSDYIRLKFILLTHLSGILISMIGLIFLARSNDLMWLLIVGNGIAAGTFSTVNSVSWPRFFGVKHLGAISGFNMSWMVAGSALGPFIFSLSLRYWSSYSWITVILAIITLVLTILSFKADIPHEKNTG